MKLPWASQERGHSSRRSTAPGTWGPGTGLAMWLRLRLPSRSPRPRFRLALLSAALAETINMVHCHIEPSSCTRRAARQLQLHLLLFSPQSGGGSFARLNAAFSHARPSCYVHLQAVHACMIW
jgi:hypothetical protein